MKVELKCENCGKIFYVSPCYAKEGRCYCCRKCANEGRRGKVPWNKGLTKETDNRVEKYAKTKQNKPLSKSHKLALSLSHKGKPSSRKGIKLSDETKLKISKAKKGTIPWIKGKKHTKETIEKVRKAKLGKTYSEEKKKEMTEKRLATKRKNGTMCYSKPEQEIKDLLTKKFKDVKCQYRSELYPFNCDFYIPESDLYIEYQGHWNHGKHAFNKDDKDDLKKLKNWKDNLLKHPTYKTAINVWTIRDPLKRETAKHNQLNWIEFFNMDQFLNWYNTF